MKQWLFIVFFLKSEIFEHYLLFWLQISLKISEFYYSIYLEKCPFAHYLPKRTEIEHHLSKFEHQK